ncbi:hypothetical protein LINPERHAP1_LOCUS13186 [Linum perenne]
MKVSLPTGQQVHVSHIGSVFLTPTIMIQTVLVIPTFTFNLLSMSYLTNHHKCSLTFYHDRCVIQDLQFRQRIGLTELVNGLNQFHYPMHNVDCSSICFVVKPMI